MVGWWVVGQANQVGLRSHGVYNTRNKRYVARTFEALTRAAAAAEAGVGCPAL